MFDFGLNQSRPKLQLSCRSRNFKFWNKINIKMCTRCSGVFLKTNDWQGSKNRFSVRVCGSCFELHILDRNYVPENVAFFGGDKFFILFVNLDFFWQLVIAKTM